jgi:archaemetzincin
VKCTVLPKQELPVVGYNASRGQYSGEVFLREVAKLRVEAGAKHLGIFDVDIYAKGLKFIFGIALIGGDFALISLKRLSFPEELLFERALKEAIHELGHTLGMTHCPRKDCVMSFSNSLQDVDAKNADFCEEHSAQLRLILGEG